MRVHHIDCCTLDPLTIALVPRRFRSDSTHIVSRCLLVETGDRLVLVDTGIGTADVAAPHRRLGRPFVALSRPRLDPARTALAHVRRLGHDPGDVTDVALTHLDLDHTGGLADFPRARVHVALAEGRRAFARPGVLDRVRYRPAHWAHHPRWVPYGDEGGERWMGIEGVRPLAGLDGLALVPLPGHTGGHRGVAVRTAGGWLLHAGDAFYHQAEIDPASPRVSPASRGFQAALGADRRAVAASRATLRRLAAERGDEVRIVCSHDPRGGVPL